MPGPALDRAMASALELAEAAGRAYRLGWEFTDRDFRRLPERNLIKRAADVRLVHTAAAGFGAALPGASAGCVPRISGADT